MSQENEPTDELIEGVEKYLKYVDLFKVKDSTIGQLEEKLLILKVRAWQTQLYEGTPLQDYNLMLDVLEDAITERYEEQSRRN